jgi:hypothetical protein
VSLRDRIRDAVYDAATTSDGEPAGDRRATQAAAMLAHTASQNGHAVMAAAISTLGAAAAAAASNFAYPPGEYATFQEGGKR